MSHPLHDRKRGGLHPALIASVMPSTSAPIDPPPLSAQSVVEDDTAVAKSIEKRMEMVANPLEVGTQKQGTHSLHKGSGVAPISSALAFPAFGLSPSLSSVGMQAFMAVVAGAVVVGSYFAYTKYKTGRASSSFIPQRSGGILGRGLASISRAAPSNVNFMDDPANLNILFGNT